MPADRKDGGRRRFWGVFPHAADRQVTGRGYVVREVDELGRALDERNYGGMVAPRVYRREAAAERQAARLTAAPDHRTV